LKWEGWASAAGLSGLDVDELVVGGDSWWRSSRPPKSSSRRVRPLLCAEGAALLPEVASAMRRMVAQDFCFCDGDVGIVCDPFRQQAERDGSVAKGRPIAC